MKGTEFLFDNYCLVFFEQLVEVPTVRVSSVTDATGAGDAFLGGLVSGWCSSFAYDVISCHWAPSWLT